jgi:hypothetical protein
MDIVNCLWFGKIGSLERLMLESFSRYSEVHLWSYFDLNVDIKNVHVRDGREILPEEDVFLYPLTMDLPFGGGTHVGFSELFRYKVLYEKGGWYSDMDVTCLKPLSQFGEYFFRTHGRLPVVGNIMKCPAKSELMLKCYEESKRTINDTTTDWHLGMKILARFIFELQLDKFILDDFCNVDILSVVKDLTRNNSQAPASWTFIHWMNTIFDRNSYHANSVYGKLLEKYKIKDVKMIRNKIF